MEPTRPYDSAFKSLLNTYFISQCFSMLDSRDHLPGFGPPNHHPTPQPSSAESKLKPPRHTPINHHSTPKPSRKVEKQPLLLFVALRARPCVASLAGPTNPTSPASGRLISAAPVTVLRFSQLFHRNKTFPQSFSPISWKFRCWRSNNAQRRAPSRCPN